MDYFSEPFHFASFQIILNDLKIYGKNRNVMAKCLPSSIITIATKQSVHEYRQEAKKHWYDDDNQYITTHFDYQVIKPIVQSFDINVTPLFIFEADHLICIDDIKRLCYRNNVSVDDFKNWLNEKYHKFSWMSNPSIDLSFKHLFSSEYASDVDKRLANWS